jgi:hypothetical protein
MMEMDGMGAMMGWMMGFGLLGWVLVIGLLVTIVILLVKILRRTGPRDQAASPPGRQGSGDARL